MISPLLLDIFGRMAGTRRADGRFRDVTPGRQAFSIDTVSTATSIVFNTGTRHRGTESATAWDDHTVRVVFKRGDNRYTHNVSWYSEE